MPEKCLFSKGNGRNSLSSESKIFQVKDFQLCLVRYKEFRLKRPWFAVLSGPFY